MIRVSWLKSDYTGRPLLPHSAHGPVPFAKCLCFTAQYESIWSSPLKEKQCSRNKPDCTVFINKRKGILFSVATWIYRGGFQTISRWKSLLIHNKASKSNTMYLQCSVYMLAAAQMWIQSSCTYVASEHWTWKASSIPGITSANPTDSIHTNHQFRAFNSNVLFH